MNHDYALYVLCDDNDLLKVKIDKTSKNITALMKEFSLSKSYVLLKYWPGKEYYSIKTLVLNHQLLAADRLKNEQTSRLTEWFTTSLKTIDFVVNEIVTEYKSNQLKNI